MIKLGVFDLDGTLLTSDGRLPDTFWEDLKLLNARGVNVAIASARPVQFLFDMFDHENDLLISGEDGNIFFQGSKLLHARYISDELVKKVGDIVEKHEDLAMLCTGLDSIYVSQKDYNRFIQWGKGQFMPETPQELQGNEKICKIHVLCRDGIEKAKETINVIFSDVNTIADVQESGYGWIGITEKGSNKAEAVRFFQKFLNIKDDETAVFGDSSNDIPMFDLTKYSFAMKNALPDVRANANYVTMEDNDHNGAIKALLELTE